MTRARLVERETISGAEVRRLVAVAAGTVEEPPPPPAVETALSDR